MEIQHHLLYITFLWSSIPIPMRYYLDLWSQYKDTLFEFKCGSLWYIWVLLIYIKCWLVISWRLPTLSSHEVESSRIAFWMILYCIHSSIFFWLIEVWLNRIVFLLLLLFNQWSQIIYEFIVPYDFGRSQRIYGGVQIAPLFLPIIDQCKRRHVLYFFSTINAIINKSTIQYCMASLCYCWWNEHTGMISISTSNNNSKYTALFYQMI